MRLLVSVVMSVLVLGWGAGSAAAATFDVTSVGDSGAGTLRQAILDANAAAGPDTVHFDIGALGGVISPESPLPAINEALTIDGTSDPDYLGEPVVFLDGSAAGVLANGLTINAGPTTVKALSIDSFANSGLALVSGSATLLGNWIGNSGSGNAGAGVRLSAGVSNSTIGGIADGDGNQIMGNAGGVVLESGSGLGNRILGNSIHGNDAGAGGLGIDLNDDGVTANDEPDASTGANTSVNFPVLSNLTVGDTSTSVAGDLDARPSTMYRIEFFGVSQCDPSGNGEGDSYLGSVDVNTDADGHAAISATRPGALAERFVTATATDPAGNTSEFSPCEAGPPSGVVVSNGTVQLGVNKTGSLNYNCVPGEPGCPGASAEGTGPVGLRYVPLNLDSTAPGCPCEGWGVGDMASGLSGFANEDAGNGNITPVSLTRSPDGKQATVVVDVADASIPDRSLRVTHVYRPSALSQNLYEDVISVKNTGTQPLTDLLFRRVMDWDIEPSAFSEWVTNHGTSPQLRFDSDDGFASADPLSGPAYLQSQSVCGPGYTGHCEFADLGSGGTYPTVTTPDDHGGLFDFGFGALPAGATKVITTYYGAAPSEAAAVAALNAGGAQVYSLGQSDCPNGGDTAGCSALPAGAGPAQGTPATFMFGFVTTSGDLSITQSDSPDPAAPGQEVAYTLTVHNNGPDAAAAVQVEDTLPSGAGVTIGAITTSKGSCAAPAGGKVVCSLGSMPSGSTETVTVHATRASAGTLTNAATVSSPSEDANPGNNATTETTTVQPLATLSIDDVTVTEGNSGTTTATFTVTRAGDTSGASSVHYATSAGTATAGADFTGAPDTTLSFGAGQTTGTLEVAVLGDTLDEENETFTVQLSSPTGATIDDGSGAGTIVDDDAAAPPVVVPAVSVGDATASPEGDSGTRQATFAVTLSQPTTVPVAVSYATADGTATQPADYAAVSGSVSFAPGETAKTVAVAVKGDLLEEADETFRLVLSSPSGATLGTAQGTGTIVDDDEAAPGSEGPGTVDRDDLFCGRQHRGKCKGMKFKGLFDRPGNAVWTFAAYNPKPGSAAAAAARQLQLGRVGKAIKKAGTVSGRFKLRGAKADRLAKKVKRAGYRNIRVTLAFTTKAGKRYVVQRSASLKG
ncbi:MAG TPA: Calx-beta domain-containing protein [Solirubrobacteraceae bacterium]|nr:Calx-beta domain-containing protein [Solirubrobacteraceae bacterium]